MSIKLGTESDKTFKRRTKLGAQALDLTGSDDDETRAKDIIADILTTVYGPAGWCKGREVIVSDSRVDRATTLLNAALDNWIGDAEDYTAD